MNQNEAAKAEGNDGTESLDLLGKLKTQVFESDDEKLALAMGRPVEEIKAWFGGEEIDEDAQEKIHGLAQERLGE
jgi:hypothetical protein